MVATGELFGSLVTDDAKLWRSIRSEIKTWASKSAKSWFRKAMTVKLQLSIRRVKPVKVSKKVLLITSNNPEAEKAVEACVESGKRHGEEHDLEILRLEEDLEISDFLKRYDLTWNERYSEAHTPFSHVKLFCLHFKSWLNCAELGEPMLVLQQGSVFRSRVPTLRFKDVAVLGTSDQSLESRSKEKEVFYPRRSLENGYCYAVTPHGARKLIEATQREMVYSVKQFICKRRVDIICCTEQHRPVDLTEALSPPQDIVDPQDVIWAHYRADD